MLISTNFNLAAVRKELDLFYPLLKSLKIGVLDGPISEEDIVYNPGANPADLEIASIKEAFDRMGVSYEVIDPSQDGWLQNMMQCNPIVINIHGEYGEDGRLQGLLDIMDKSYIGSGLENSAVSISKPLFKLVAQQMGFQTPKFFKKEWSGTPAITDIDSMQFPIMAKISNGGCSIGMEKIDSKNDLKYFMKANHDKLDRYFFEEYIDGRFITVGVLQVGEDCLVFPPLEVITKNGFYNEEAKKDHSEAGLATYTFPDDEVCRDGGSLQKIAYEVFTKTGAKNLARIDFMVDKDGTPWLLELNTIAGLSSTGNFASAGKKVGLTYDEILMMILKSSLENTPYKIATSSENRFCARFMKRDL